MGAMRDLEGDLTTSYQTPRDSSKVNTMSMNKDRNFRQEASVIVQVTASRGKIVVGFWVCFH
jgi:hypothetical protein